jgi:superfamily II DNA or RNA helicase
MTQNNKNISDKVKKELLSYQIGNADNIIRILNNNGTVLDASDTGTGKTYTAVASCAQLKLNPLIICPKAVISAWKRVCKIFNVDPFFIVNYETIKNLKYYDDRGNRKKCSYIKYNEETKHYSWKNIPKNVVFIFDEAHKCASLSTFNGLLLLATKETTNNFIILLSATIADHPEKFKLFFYILNFISKNDVDKLDLDFKKYMNIVERWIMRDPRPMLRIHNMLYPNRATRMSIDVLGDLFPETQITATPYSMGKTREVEIQMEYETIYKELENLKTKSKSGKLATNPLVLILRAHQKIELLKIPTFVELANDFLHDGFSVVIFVNFTQTLKSIAKLLFTKCLIYGEQSDTERQTNIDNFQSNKERLIVCNIKAGGVGISLHDTDGKHRRVSLISPCWSSIDLTQALGRVHRAGSISKSLQRIIYAANTVEEKIADKLQQKIKELNSINNGDLDLSNIVFEKQHKQMRNMNNSSKLS